MSPSSTRSSPHAAKYKRALELLRDATNHGLGGHEWIQTRQDIENFLKP